MKSRLKFIFIHNLLTGNKYNRLLILIVGVLSVMSFIAFQMLGLSLAYNDAMSHLNLARLVFDNQEPGLAQIGGVWLPVNHLPPLVFIWNDWAWHSGFAGTFFSMAAFVLSALMIYQIVFSLTQSKLASILSYLVFILNPNMLYLQSTPLTEPLYLVFFISSVYLFTIWVARQRSEYLFLMGLSGFLQVLTRYDGWFVVGIQILVVLLTDIFYFKNKFSKSVGKAFIFASPVAFGIFLWLMWNVLIFNDPLFFALGPYSAHAQQKLIDTSSPLFAKGNLSAAFKSYAYAAATNIGVFTMIISQIGLVVFMLVKNKQHLLVRMLFTLGVFAPFIFNVVALYLGFSILNLPELNWRPNENQSALWFNVRYGILALPAVAIFYGYIAHRGKRLFALLTVVLLIQTLFIWKEGLVTITDGTIGSSAFVNHDISSFLGSGVKKDETILLAISYFNPVAFHSRVQLSQLVHEGVSKKWSDALDNPQNHAKWIVMSKNRIGDPVYESLIIKNNSNFLKYYRLEFSGNGANIYKLNDEIAQTAPK